MVRRRNPSSLCPLPLPSSPSPSLFIGDVEFDLFFFIKQLLGSGHDVTGLTVGDEGSDKMTKPPFSRFSEIVSAGGRTVWGDLAEVGKAVGGASFDVVLDNNGKDLDTVSIQALLSAPNPDDPLSDNVAKHWKLNEAEAVGTAKEWTRLYASGA